MARSTSSSSASDPYRLLITAGPTHEPIDRVRYLANRSSGRMGLALTEAAIQRQWPTTLLLGPTPLQPPQFSHLQLYRFQTTAELERLLHEHWPQHDVLIMAAAVADFRPKAPEGEAKLRRTETGMSLELEPTPDLLAQLANHTRPDQLVIGFALEPAANLAECAQGKLQSKKIHAIVANPLETMDAAEIEATLFLADGRQLSPSGCLPKTSFAAWLLEQVAELHPRST